MKLSFLLSFLISFYVCAETKKVSQNYDPVQFKGQKRSLIDWDAIQLEEFFDYTIWEAETLTKKSDPMYRVYKREELLRETMGKILSCVGECNIYRGKGYVNASFRSKIIEGDDIITGENSYAWVFLVDGTLARIAPKTSVSFKEINITNTEVFYVLRMNEGHLSWLARLPFKMKPSNLEETDPLFFPLRVKEANQLHYRHLEKDKQTEEIVLKSQGEVSKDNLEQFNFLNKLVEENNQMIDKKISRVLMIMPNASIEGQNLQLELHYNLGQKSFIKLKDPIDLYEIDEKKDEVKQYAQVYFRGYENVEAKDISVGNWYVMNEAGRVLDEFPQGDKDFHLLELLVKRVPSLMIARELWLKPLTPILNTKTQSNTLASVYGYRLWDKDHKDDYALGNETKLRLEYLKEYSRRTETTHLATVNKLNQRLEAEKSNSQMGEAPDQKYYHRALMAYYEKLSNLYDPKVEEALELNRLGYHFWLMINAKGNP